MNIEIMKWKKEAKKKYVKIVDELDGSSQHENVVDFWIAGYISKCRYIYDMNIFKRGNNQHFVEIEV